ncbi:MAG: hypothetical protein WD294_05255 [Phycisphaeraceae bacterium]
MMSQATHAVKWSMVGAMLLTLSMSQALAQDVTAEALAGYRLATGARAVLERAEVLDSPHAQLAEELLAMAVTQRATDQHAWHLRLEAAEMVGDLTTLRATLGNYLQQYPRDDTAQLRLIDLLASEEANVADRIAMYERLLQGSRADRLSPALRSRVAYRAAVLYREQGRTRGYAERLQDALTLDESNPAAAAEALSFLQQRGADRVEIMQALLTLLAADPGNSATHERIARELLAAGLYEQAATWYGAVSHLWEVEGAPDQDAVMSIVYEWTLALWGANRRSEAMGLIDAFADAVGLEDVANLPVGLQTLRVAMLQSQEDDQQAAEAFETLTAALRARHEDDPENADHLADLAWAHLLLGEGDDVSAMMQKLETMLPLDDPTMRRLRIWHAARQGDAEEAREIFAEADQPTAMEQLGVHLAESAQMSREEQVQALTAIYESAADRLAGVWAADRLRKLNSRPQPSGEARTIGRLVQAVPGVLREGAAVPGELTRLTVSPVSRRLDYGQPVQLEVDLANRSSVPLSLGSDGAVAATVMLVPQVRIGDGETISLSPQFVAMDRRLRLEAGRTVRVRTRLDQPDLVALLNEHPDEAIALSVLAVLNPVLVEDGRFLPGMFGTAMDVPSIVRTRVRPSQENAEALAERLSADDPTVRFYSAARLIALAAEAEQAGGQPISDRSMEAVEAFYAEQSPAGRAFLISYVVSDAVAGAESVAFEQLLERARTDEADLVQVMLLTAGEMPDPIALEVALAREQNAVGRIARLVEQTMKDADEPAADEPGK